MHGASERNPSSGLSDHTSGRARRRGRRHPPHQNIVCCPIFVSSNTKAPFPWRGHWNLFSDLNTLQRAEQRERRWRPTPMRLVIALARKTSLKGNGRQPSIYVLKRNPQRTLKESTTNGSGEPALLHLETSYERLCHTTFQDGEACISIRQSTRTRDIRYPFLCISCFVSGCVIRWTAGSTRSKRQRLSGRPTELPNSKKVAA